MSLPKKWAVKRTKDTAEVINDYFNKLDGVNYYSRIPLRDMYDFVHSEQLHGPEYNPPRALDKIKQGFTEISFEDFLKYVVNKTERPLVQDYEQITVPHDLLCEAYRSANNYQFGEMRARINPWTRITTARDIRFFYNDIGFGLCSTWKNKLEEAFPWLKEDKKEIVLQYGGKVDGLDFFIEDGGRETSLIAIRDVGNFENKGFYLNSNYNWEIKEDNFGMKVLIPKRK